MNRGEVWWGELPDAGRRPFLVLSRQSAVAVLSGVIVAEITRTIRGIPTEVRLDVDDGMPSPCVVSLDNLFTAPKWAMTDRLMALGIDRMHEVCVALGVATGC